MEIAALAVSLTALAVSAWSSRRQLALARQANSVQVLVDMFTEHRGDALARARAYVRGNEVTRLDPTQGFRAFGDMENDVRRLAWYYDNLGVLVAHGVVDLTPVAGYLGGSVLTCWESLRGFVEAERAKRARDPDPGRWQDYFENLATLVREMPPDLARRNAQLWRTKIHSQVASRGVE